MLSFTAAPAAHTCAAPGSGDPVADGVVDGLADAEVEVDGSADASDESSLLQPTSTVASTAAQGRISRRVRRGINISVWIEWRVRHESDLPIQVASQGCADRGKDPTRR